ncbi:hypothetical protein Ae406Ps2_1383 [Pseudonocardia sp. Ae406_Ps2]|nr:hypothetical protein Ae406Ps2_1383 [Pseudonocardia sp. Ae406_Ps2]OLM06820.1 hypothetical protein Ae331Ps2_4530c [Pseudonocardia sp. Ae331_Ps2]
MRRVRVTDATDAPGHAPPGAATARSPTLVG